MEIIYERCCGLDIHKALIVACFLGNGKKEIKTFGTSTDELLNMCAWLKSRKVEKVAMESTGVFWKPIINIFELEDIPALLVNAQHVKNVPGRKTDVKDAEWIADLLKHGLLRASFVPNRDMRELRELCRYRTSIIEERARELNRLEKVLQGANIKLTNVLSRVETQTGFEIVKALSEGVVNPDLLSMLAKGKAKAKADELKIALKGLIQPHQQMMLKSMLNHISNLDNTIATLNLEIETRLAAENETVKLLDEITGVGIASAQTIIAEIGTDMSQFPKAENLASWAGLCPGNDESAGKRKSGKVRKGNPTLKKTLVQCGRSAANSKNTYLNSMYKRIAARRGAKRATVAVAHAILIICFHMIKDKTHYKDLGADFYASISKEAILKRSILNIQKLGYFVTIQKNEIA